MAYATPSTTSTDDLAAAFDEALGTVRHLYASSKSAEALPLARALQEIAERRGDTVMRRRALVACGLVTADSGDVVGGIDRQVEALRLASQEGSVVEQSRAWSNIGLMFGIAGAYSIAVPCYERALALTESQPEPLHPRYAATVNLANSHYQLRNFEVGLKHGMRALDLLLPAYAEQDPHSTILLHRNLVRLLVATGRSADAEPHLRTIALLASRTESSRTYIAAATARAAYELATGQMDVALTRVERALEKAHRVPAALCETLQFAVHAEQAAGNAGRALERLRELSDLVHRTGLARATVHIELAALGDLEALDTDDPTRHQRAQLAQALSPRERPLAWDALQRLAIAAVLKMDRTGSHGVRVGALTKALALASGRGPLEALEIGMAAELHDIGLHSVPAHILASRETLSEPERAAIRRHAEGGAEALRASDHPRLLLAQDIAQYHHARWDGRGYPERVAGASIPAPARMCAIADAYDAMVCGLYGREPRPMDAALEVLRQEAGAQFDPDLVPRFISMIRSQSAELGFEVSARAGSNNFFELVASLQEDRGLI